MTIQHKDIPDAQLHEPKGVSTALSNQTYVADGAGSGNWAEPEPKGVSGANSNEVYLADGLGSGSWGPVPASPIDSGAARHGEILTADGAGNADWGRLVWKDLIGNVVSRGTGSGWPSFSNYIGASVDAYAFSIGDAVHFYFHIPHDYAIGTDIFLHAHWGHNGTSISGTMRWDYECTYSKGHNQANFSAPVTGSITYNTVDLATTPRYRHRVDEIQLSSTAPSASQLDTNILEPDGLIMMHFEAGAIPAIAGGTVNEPFLFTVDIHYQADIEGTLNKVPNFYT